MLTNSPAALDQRRLLQDSAVMGGFVLGLGENETPDQAGNGQAVAIVQALFKKFKAQPA